MAIKVSGEEMAGGRIQSSPAFYSQSVTGTLSQMSRLGACGTTRHRASQGGIRMAKEGRRLPVDVDRMGEPFLLTN